MKSEVRPGQEYKQTSKQRKWGRGSNSPFCSLLPPGCLGFTVLNSKDRCVCNKPSIPQITSKQRILAVSINT